MKIGEYSAAAGAAGRSKEPAVAATALYLPIFMKPGQSPPNGTPTA
jgi:hypothetical protein